MTQSPLDVYRIDMKYIRKYQGELLGVLNFNLMVPVEDILIKKSIQRFVGTIMKRYE